MADVDEEMSLEVQLSLISQSTLNLMNLLLFLLKMVKPSISLETTISRGRKEKTGMYR
jgi:hypothetical protein